jgi:RHS repeat-associated protein
VIVALFVEELQEWINIRSDWYQADGRLQRSGEMWFDPAIYKNFNAWSGFKLETTGMSFILGSYSVKITVTTSSGATVYENQIDFDAIKEPTDPPGQYLEQEAMTSQDQPLGEEKTLFTFTDGQVFAALMYEYYSVEIDSATGFKMEWYYDEKESVYIPDFGLVSIPSPFQYSDPEIWTDEFEPSQFFYGLSDQLTLPDSINFLGTYLKGQWHVDFLIKMDRGDSEWQVVTSLPFTIDNEPPVVKITQPEEGYETEKAKLALLLGTASDNIGVERVTWKNGDSQGTASGTDDWQVNNIPLHKDSNFITVKASDAAENEGEKTIKVIFNNSPPELSMEAPSVAIINEPYSLSLHASDINENLRDVTIHWGDGSSETRKISGSEADVAFAHTYNSGGIFPLTGVATDEEDETAIAIQPVVVGDEELAKKLEDCLAQVYDPIDLSTGAQTLRHTFLPVQGVLPIAFKLGYYSLLLEEGSVGKAWEDKRFGTFLEELPNGDVKAHWTTNKFNLFPTDGEGGYQTLEVKCHFDRLVKNADGRFTLTRQSGKVYKFNAQGRLEQIGNTQGQFLELSYDGAGRLHAVTEPISGVFLQYAYNAEGLLETVTDPLDRQVRLEYDENHHLIKLTDAAGQTIRYTYNEAGQIVSGTNTEGKLIFRNTFDEQQRVIAQDNGINGLAQFAYTNDNGRIRAATVTDRLGKTSNYTFNDNFQVVELIDEAGNKTTYPYDDTGKRTRVTDGNGNTTSYAYDSNGNLQTVTDAANHQTHFVYDGNNNLLSVTNALGKQIKFVYENNLLQSMTDPLDNVTRYTYNSAGQVLTKTRPRGGIVSYEYANGLPIRITNTSGGVSELGYDLAGRLTTVTDVDGNATTLVYDGVDRLNKVINPLGHEVSMTYDSRNNLLAFTDANGNVTRREYDISGKLIKQINALNQVTRYEYDANGRLIRVIDALSQVTELGYDVAGRLISVTNPLGHTQILEYDAADNLLKRFDALGKRETWFKYDPLNNPVKVTDALDNSSHFEYDELSRLVESVDPLNRATQFDYDALNRSVSSVDALSGTSSQGFDADGNQVSLTDPNSNTTQFEFDLSGQLVQESVATGDQVKYTYDAKDLLTQVTNGREQQRQFEYDVLGRLSGWSDPDGSVAYSYDNNGNVLTVTDASGTIAREFDALNRVTQYTDVRGNTLRYAYDSVGNLVGLTYPDGKLVAYEYDAAGQLVKVTDWAARVTTYTYDENGRLISTLRPNGTKMTRSYDDAGQLVQQVDIVVATSEVINQFDFEYDAAGNIIKEVTFPEADPDINLVMSYQAANRLATVDNEAVDFDADGNMLAGGVNQFDSRNRLVQAGEVVYSYDAENQRIGVNQTQYVINSQPALSQVLVKTEANGTQTYYVYGLGLIGQESNGEYLTYHFDFRGSTVALTDESKQVVERFQYSPYGVLLSGDISITPFLFNGMYGVMTDSSGLYYMRARFYGPEIRRFVNQDVLLGNVDEGQTLNRYAFVTGQPVSFVDPFGLEGAAITDEQRNLAESGNFLEFWKSRWACLDPVAKTALIGWGKGESIDATWFERLSAAYTWWSLSSYIDDYNLSVSMKEIGEQLAKAHVRSIDADKFSLPFLLSPRQVADYHHEVFEKNNIPPYLFGGTLPAGLYIPDFFDGMILFGAYSPVPDGWSPMMFDANVYSNMWCEDCDTSP